MEMNGTSIWENMNGPGDGCVKWNKPGLWGKKMFSDLTHTMNFQLTNLAEVERMLLI